MLTDKPNFPDFTNEGYTIQTLLGHNLTGGRVTYKANILETQEKVVIKQFQFAQIGTTWSGFAAFEREIELLRQLNHPQIPKCLDCFETPSGFCLVQEYKEAPSLATSRQFTPLDIEKIAIGVLEILIYLQQQQPAIIHRDIKPENILMDAKSQIYLVDFGLARSDEEQMSASTTVKGTLGFMPPEQIFGRSLTKSADLYSLGATLICLLTKTSSAQIGNLVDDSFRFNIKQLLPNIAPRWQNWLEKITAPNAAQRYPDAVTALNELRQLQVVTPTQKVNLSQRIPQIVTLSFIFAGAMTSLALFKEPKADILPLQYEPAPPNYRHLPHHPRRIPRPELGTSCVGCKLRYLDLQAADLRSIDFENADLSGANLAGADLRGASLKGADLSNANLAGANLESVDLESADLEGAIMPDGLIHP
jgi:serine/threonine protein kinase